MIRQLLSPLDAMISLTCPGCRRTLRVKEELAGKKGKCSCGHVMTVPRPQAPADPPSRRLVTEVSVARIDFGLERLMCVNTVLAAHWQGTLEHPHERF